MATISLVRVDNRLIHGQVATGLVNKCSAARIVVADDKSAANDLSRDVLSLAKPAGVDLDIFTVQEAVDAWKVDAFGPKGPVMLIFKSIPAAYTAYNAGLDFTSLQIGGTGIAPGRTRIEGAISIDAPEKGMLDELAAKGVDVFLQQTVQTKITRWQELSHKIKI